MKTVKLITCSDAAQAHIIQGALENEGISSLLHNENMSTLLRGYINDIAGVDVLVDEADYEAAVRLLEQNEMIPEQLKYCPFCGSSDIVEERASATGCYVGHRLFVGGYSSGK